MYVEEFMTKDPATCGPDERINEAARTMRDRGVGSLVVVEGGRVVGLVTDRQLVVRGLAEGRADRPVREVMTERPATVRADDTLFRAVDELHHAGIVRRLPVVDGNDRLVGIVSVGDIATVARDLIDVILLEETHAALSETGGPTGGQRVADRLRRPSREIAPTERRAPPAGLPAARSGVGPS
jgi:CBS domain-containing protein